MSVKFVFIFVVYLINVSIGKKYFILNLWAGKNDLERNDLDGIFLVIYNSELREYLTG